MADDEKPSHTVTIGGKDYDIFGASSVDEALKQAQKYRQDTLNQKFIQNANEAPEWAKPFMAIQDAALSGIDTLSAGMIPKAVDKLTGTDDATMTTAASKNRMGWAAPALDTAMFARAIPTAVPNLVKWAGGGPAAKTMVGTLGTAGEGGVYGGVDAATHDRPVGPEAMIGAGGGAAGYQIGNVINKGWKWLRGINDIPANAGIKVMPKNPTKDQLAEITLNQAKAKAGLSDDVLAQQARVRAAAEKLA